MEYQKLLIAFCFYSLFVQQSQLTYAGKHLYPRDQAFYLLQFKQGLTIGRNVHYYCDEDTHAKTFSWNVTGDCCEWDGVTCNGFTGHVIGLEISSSCLSGTIHANNSLTKLVHLQRLNLAFNYLDDFPLGNSISELTSLTHLNLSDSGFLKGKMIPPGLSKLSKLISLDLTWNFIQVGQTTLTSLLHNLTNLEVLLFRNVHAPFELPKNFPSSLRKLSLEGTDMFGNITDSQLFHLPNLQVLRLGWNPLITGILPNFNWSFSGSILELDFSHTGIFGKVPDSVGNLHSLCYLDLSSNSLSGSIPESFGNLTAITELRHTGNNFTVSVLSSISKLNKLVHLDLSNNHFQGSFPESIGNLTNIIKLTLQCNNFTVWPTMYLWSLNLENNFLQGPLHQSICDLYNLQVLILAQNNFSGSIPGCLGGFVFLLEKPKWYVNFAEDIAQQIAANKRTRQKKRRQRKMN
ncbi:hypothetical protein R3W88_021395 [Solanum pinnatisectum]|uniref:Leucine-rich repeat-containing N-terminal plant-type domain-containing protein n=1 Tax=Solanum pinnatisectum TaxID=50273 RepID=A0AAV9LRQ7_9SOLN|nr:hypothetical protein R3W88_021395 [Solanum pinnatisectum]